MNRIPFWFVAALAAGLCTVWAAGGEAPAEATPDQQAQRLLARWKDGATTAEQRADLTEQLLELGEVGARRLAPVAAQELARKRPAYLQRFEKEAHALLRSRWGKTPQAAEAEVQSLRKTVTDVTQSASLTKDMIVEKADPAMKRLGELLIVERGELLQKHPELKAARDELTALSEACAQAVEKLSPEDRKRLASVVARSPQPAALERELLDQESLIALLATPMNDADRRVLLANAQLAGQIDPSEARGILICNQMRLKAGRSALEIDVRLCDAARGHSKDMHEKGFFSHTSIVPGKESPGQRAKLAGTTGSAENIYHGISNPEDAIRGWWHSPGHHKNMMAAHERVGLGRHESHWTQMFGR